MESQRKNGDNKPSFKEFYTLKEAAQHLSLLSGEMVNEADVYRLVLQGPLTVSVYLDSTPAKRYTQAGVGGEPQKTPIHILGMEMPGDTVVQIKGYFDLSMEGGGYLDIEYELQRINGSVEPKRICLNGTYVEASNGQVYQLQEYINGGFQGYGLLPSVDKNEISCSDSERQTDSLPGDNKIEEGSAPNQESNDAAESKQVPKKASYIAAHILRPAGCLPINRKFMFRKSALDELNKKKSTTADSGEKKKLSNEANSPISAIRKKNPSPPKKEVKVDGGETQEEKINVVSVEPVTSKHDIPKLPETGLLRLAQIIGNAKAGIPAIIPVSRSKWYEGIQEGTYPESVKIGVRSVAWRVEDIRALLESFRTEKEAK